MEKALEDLKFKDQVEDTLYDDDVKAVREEFSKTLEDLQLKTAVASRLPIKLPPQICVAKLNNAELLNLKKSIADKKSIFLPYREALEFKDQVEGKLAQTKKQLRLGILTTPSN